MKYIAPFAVLFLAVAVHAGDAKTFKPNSDGCIVNWLMLDSPIDLDDSASEHEEASQKGFFAKDFFPNQQKCTPAEGEKVKVGNAEKKWKAVQSDESLV